MKIDSNIFSLQLKDSNRICFEKARQTKRKIETIIGLQAYNKGSGGGYSVSVSGPR